MPVRIQHRQKRADQHGPGQHRLAGNCLRVDFQHRENKIIGRQRQQISVRRIGVDKTDQKRICLIVYDITEQILKNKHYTLPKDVYDQQVHSRSQLPAPVIVCDGESCP